MKQIIAYNQRIKATINEVISESKYLETGKYILDPRLKYSYKNDKKSVKYIKNTLFKNNFHWYSNKKNIKDFAKRILTPKYIEIKNDIKSINFQGSIVLFTNNISDSKDIKIFDLKRNKVLSIYKQSRTFNQVISNYNYYNPFFKVPKLISYDINKKVIIEESITSKPNDTWSKTEYEKITNEIFQIYINYYTNYSKKYNNLQSYDMKNISDIILELKKYQQLSGFIYEMEKFLEFNEQLVEIPTIRQHGDFSFHNILLSQDNIIYFIDWEYSGEYMIFYDLFNLMISEAIINSDFTLIKNYLLGIYDSYFEIIFLNFKTKYNKNIRKKYFYLFILEKLYNRILDKPNETVMTMYDRYSKIFHIVKGMEESKNFNGVQ